MAHFLRGKQAGVQNDFSTTLTPDLFVLDDLNRFGVSSLITTLAYDPVQSLLAAGTRSTQVGTGQIYVFGQKRISVTLALPTRKASVKQLEFCSDRLLCLDDRNDFSVYSLVTKKLVVSYSPPGQVLCYASDPTLDFVLLGMASGEILAYDLDRETLAPFRLPCFWSEYNSRAKLVPIVTLALHPRDIGTLLIGYTEGAAIYSFKQNKALKFFHYQVPKGAPGGDGDPASLTINRNPKLTQAVWHPSGTFILTGHDDSSLVTWDPKDGRIIMARTLTDTQVNQVAPRATTFGPDAGSFAPKMPLMKIVWCANQDPDDTGVLVAGGTSALIPTKGLTFFELGKTPNYATSSWQVITNHFENPKRQRVIPTPPNVDVVDFCTIPRKTPWYAGAHDPIALIAVLSSGELTTLSFPSGYPVSPSNQLHPSLTYVHPFVSAMNLACVDRARWLGLTETRASGPKLLRGGAEATHPLKRYEDRTIVQTAHADGSICLWDIGHGDEVENELMLQADVSRAVGRFDNIQITHVSFAGASGELIAGLKTGEVVVFRWSRNNYSGREPPRSGPNKPQELTNITERKDPSLEEGLHPFTLLDQQDGPVTALKISDVGFVAAGFASGTIAVIDMRGPAVIYQGHLSELSQKDKSGVFRRRSQQAQTAAWATVIEFSVMTLESDSYSSILLHIGTSTGVLATFKILPEQSGRYAVEFAGSTTLNDSIVYIHPFSTQSGKSALASQSVVAGLRDGLRVDGVLLAVSKGDVRIFKPAADKGAHKTWDGLFCDAAALTRCMDIGIALVCLFGDGSARSYSIPALREIGSVKVDHILDIKRFPQALITNSGDIVGWTGPSEVALLNVWGTGKMLSPSLDTLFNPELLIPARPAISTLQWVSGTQYITPQDLDLLIGGPNCPPSRRMLAQARTDEATRRATARAQNNANVSAAAGIAPTVDPSQESWSAYINRQLAERTEKLGTMGDGIERLQENSAGWADATSKWANQQKKSFIMGAVKKGVGL